MEFVANLLDAGVDPAAWARRREAEGWHVLGCADHIFSERRAYPHVWVTLATFAGVTQRVRLTSSFANNLLRSPVEFAQAALQMQAVSGGRFEAGLGAGWDETEIRAVGLAYPGPGERAGRFAEAVRITRALFDHGSCELTGDHYTVAVPRIGPRDVPPPPLVAALGGPRTIREIAPLVDRIELKLIGAVTRGGALDLDALRSIERAHLDELVGRVRAVAPSVPLSCFVLCSAGSDERTQAISGRLAGSFVGGFFGSPESVAETVVALESAGIERVNLSAFSDSTFDELAPLLPLER